VKGEVFADSTTIAVPKMAAFNLGYLRRAAPSRSRPVSSGVILNSRGAGGGGAGSGQAGNTGSGTGAGISVQPSATPAPDAKVLEQQRQLEELRQKLHRSLLTVVEKLQRKEALSSADEGGFIRSGKAEVQVWMTDKTAASMEKLKELGFEVVLNAQNSKLIIGRVSVEKIETLARLDFVKYVSPQLSK
jgi:hypothetical protein